jgi:hypothetical protein
MHRASAAAACDWQSLTLARWPGEFQVGRRRPGPGPPTVSGATLTKFGRHATHSDRLTEAGLAVLENGIFCVQSSSQGDRDCG